MSKQFQDDLKDLLEIGYSPQHAERLALNKAEGWIEHQMAILDKKFPLVNDQALLRSSANRHWGAEITTILFFLAQVHRKCIYLLVTSMNY
jgi:hypothetical protein